jgi:hypothetical protein
MTGPSVETIRTALFDEARRRFGAARAEALAPELAALAADLVRVAQTPLAADEEPGLPLVDG